MSVHRQVLLYCDSEGCPNEGAMGNAGEFHTTARQARAWARRAGWLRRGGRDVCDLCAEEQERARRAAPARQLVGTR